MMADVSGLRVLLIAAANRRYHQVGHSLRDGFAQLGAEVTLEDPRPSALDRLLRRSLHDRLRDLIRRVRPELIVVFKGARLEPAMIQELRAESRARWANWFPDDPHAGDLARRLGPAYDAFFTHDSWSVDHHRAAGVKAHYLAFGCDPSFHQPVPVPDRFRSRIAFVGSRDEPRAHVLARLDDLHVTIWGPRWPRGPLYGSDFVRALAGAEIGLNIHQQFGPLGDAALYGHGANMRVFELAAVGTPQLADAKQDIARHLEPDREIVLYRTVAELRDRARTLAASPSLRAALAQAARERALREHTWTRRLEELIDITMHHG